MGEKDEEELEGEDGPIRERKHRLPRNCYKGRVTVMFTLCVEGHKPALTDATLVDRLILLIAEVVTKRRCSVPIFTFMPDHLHLLMHGDSDKSDVYAAMCSFTRKCGMRFPEVDFQTDFYDRVLRWFEGWEHEAWYIACNPVRKRFAQNPFDWPFTGAIGHDLHDVLGHKQ